VGQSIKVSTREEALSGASSHAVSDALERGQIVHFPSCPIALPSAADLEFLRLEMPRALTRKNVSYYSASGRLVGVDGAVGQRARAILAAHGARVREFLTLAMPSLTKDWLVGTSSFRPLEEKGRNLSAHASNELVHVDAGAYGATHGGGILRFFINVNPSADRVWATKGPFTDVFARYGAQAGLVAAEGQLTPNVIDRLRSAVFQGASRIAPAARLLDSSPYDRAMRRFHNFMKDTPEFQTSLVGHEEFHFAPGAAWMVFTDRLSHACLSGQFAFIDTFIVAREAFRLKELAPWHLLQSPKPRPVA
jgi:hypothetical protein